MGLRGRGGLGGLGGETRRVAVFVGWAEHLLVVKGCFVALGTNIFLCSDALNHK